jgi:hypothetical protein
MTFTSAALPIAEGSATQAITMARSTSKRAFAGMALELKGAGMGGSERLLTPAAKRAFRCSGIDRRLPGISC